MKSESFTTFDGTKIAYKEEGSGPPIILANGLGGSFPAWKHIVDAFKDRFTLISWDYRGLFNSETPSDLSSVTVENQVKDLFELLKLKNIQRAIFMGWSYGGQVLLEAYKQKPSIFQGLVLLNATVSDVISGLPLPNIINPVFIQMLKLWSPLWKLLATPSSMLISSGVPINVAKKTGLIGNTLDEDTFKEIALGFINLNHEVFEITLKSSQNYDGRDILSTIKIPVLVIAGTRDFIVLPSVSRKTAKLIPNSDLVFVNGTSHYTAIEQPKVVIEAIQKYFDKLKNDIISK